MDIIAAIKNGDLYIKNLGSQEYTKLDFPGKIKNVKIKPEGCALGRGCINFMDELGLIYKVENDMSYSQYENIGSAKDFYEGSAYFHIIRDNGSLLSTKIPFQPDNTLYNSYRDYKFKKISGHSMGEVIVLIDEFGNLWTNLSRGSERGRCLQITKDIVFINSIIHGSESQEIVAVDIDGNGYIFVFAHGHLKDHYKIDMAGLKISRCFSGGLDELYFIDENHNLWLGASNLSVPFKIIKSDVLSLYAFGRYTYILLVDGTLMRSERNTRDGFVIDTDIKFDKLPETMISEGETRFMKTKSARNRT